MEEEITNYYVCYKFLDSDTLHKDLRASDFWNITDDHRYWQFKPKNFTDFESSFTYGIKKDLDMKLVKILKMAENLQDLDYGRVKIPKRLSFGVATTIPLKKYTLVAEEDAIKKAAKERKKKFRIAHSGSEEVFANLEKKSNANKPESTKRDKSKKGDTSIKKRPKEADEILKILEKDDAQRMVSIGSGKPDNDVINCETPSDAESNDTPVQPASDPDGQVPVLGHSVPILPNKGVTADCTSCKLLTRKVSVLESSLAASTIEMLELKSKIATLEGELANKKGDLTNREVLETLKAQIAGANLSANEDFLKDDKIMVEDAQSHNVVIESDEVYCGNDIIVKKSVLYDAAEATTFGRRVARLCDAFYPSEVHTHSLSGFSPRAPADMIMKKITKDELKAMKKILRKMPWAGIKKPEINSSSVSQSVKYYVSEALTKHLGLNKKRDKSSQKNGNAGTSKGRPSLKGKEKSTAQKGESKRRRQISSSSEDSDVERKKTKVQEKENDVLDVAVEESNGGQDGLRQEDISDEDHDGHKSLLNESLQSVEL